MFFRKFISLLIISLFALSACQKTPALNKAVKNNTQLIRVGENIAVHTTFKDYGNFSVPANGLIINTKQGCVLIDTGWEPAQTEQILKDARRMFGRKVKFALLSHAHEDRAGGTEVLHRAGIPVFGHEKIIREAERNGFFPPDYTFSSDTSFFFGGTEIRAIFPGHGHSPDNVVYFLPEERLLFGGCFVKSNTAQNLGDTKDADLVSWKRAAEKLYNDHREIPLVIPGHGPFGNSLLLRNTVRLLRAAQKP